jgi:hypothetical protein
VLIGTSSPVLSERRELRPGFLTLGAGILGRKTERKDKQKKEGSLSQTPHKEITLLNLI